MKSHPNFIFADVALHSDCSIDDGEVQITITGFKKHVEMDTGRENDFDLAVDCLKNNLDVFDLKPETYVEVVLKETGEWDPHPLWHKYFEILEWRKHSFGE